jgi:NAD-dependent dihydropyrimidine dehydrogenase PreA subunit
MERHPTVVQLRRKPAAAPGALTAAWLREVALAAGADDVGFVDVDRPEVAEERPFIEEALPGVRTLVAFVVRTNRDNVRSPARSVANQEFHHTGDVVNDVARSIARALEERGHRAVNPSMSFPMEMSRYPGRIWVVSHKRVAVAAGLGQMGLNRLVIHPRFGNFILLGTVLTDARIDEESRPVDYNPCVECKLCVSACPVGAIAPDGHFDFMACSTHNYREFMGGFSEWVETIADSKDDADYRERVSDTETVSMWQSLSYKPSYKAAYCMSVCPAGEDVLGPFLHARASFVAQVVRPLQEKQETIYVLPGSDAEEHVRKRFPHKRVQRVRGTRRARSARQFIKSLPIAFQRGKARGLSASVRFSFTGAEAFSATVRIADGNLAVQEGDVEPVDVTVEADAGAWLSVVTGRGGLLEATTLERLQIQGDRELFRRVLSCFAR